MWSGLRKWSIIRPPTIVIILKLFHSKKANGLSTFDNGDSWRGTATEVRQDMLIAGSAQYQRFIPLKVMKSIEGVHKFIQIFLCIVFPVSFLAISLSLSMISRVTFIFQAWYNSSEASCLLRADADLPVCTQCGWFTVVWGMVQPDTCVGY